MRKTAAVLAVISILVFVVVWGVIGLKILDHAYDFLVEAYIAYGALAVFFAAFIVLRVTDRCPHCRKIKQPFGRFCSCCGKEIRK